jgi:hypothetical protein
MQAETKNQPLAEPVALSEAFRQHRESRLLNKTVEE